MLIRLSEWIKREYDPASRPDLRTERRRIARGEFPYYVEQRGRILYVDPERPASSDLVQKVLNA